MANNKMLIDASHPEETRVVVVRGNRIEEFDFEAQDRRQLRGNIYLAKVTRVEPSLQAAFIDYGGNRHGFLAFSEIHPDYYQIPAADRQALLDAEAEAASTDDDEQSVGIEEAASSGNEDDGEEEGNSNKKRSRRKSRRGGRGRKSSDENAVAADGEEEASEDSASEEENSKEDNNSQDNEQSEADPAEAGASGGDDDAPGEETDAKASEEEAAKPKKRTRRPRKPKAEKAESDDAGGEVEAKEASSTDGEADSSNSDGENGGEDTGSAKTMAAMMDIDQISEDAPEEEGASGESDDDASAEEVEKPKRRTTRRKPAAKKAKKADAEAAESDENAETGAAEVATSDSDGEQDVAAEEAAEKPKRKTTRRKPAAKKAKKVGDEAEEAAETGGENTSEAGDDAIEADNAADQEAAAEDDGEKKTRKKPRNGRRRKAKAETADENGDEDENGNDVESVGQEDALEEVAVRRPRRQYKIQEVIRRRQVMLVQVVKEERGNKGAALTTYLSLAGRYSVLMPNTARGGGISRKITNPADRKRLKEIAGSLDVPNGMGVILRTAGASREKEEIERDFDYLMRLWENVRELTLESSAPFLVYEEGSLIKRSIRDLYNKDIGEIIVSGEEGYREAKDFMRMLMPGHGRNVKLYKGEQPLLAKFNIESQLDKMVTPQVTLKSGGYLIINQTEALVAIDVNSGRSTREHSIEATALQTNLEAAEEVARQLRLRDLAGLVVIDFIDMEEKRNNRAVERKLKECLKNDRARIQVGHISHFGLMEMSRQRIRASVLESTMAVCPTCQGVGHVRSEPSFGLHILRGIDDHLNRHSRNDVTVKVPPSIAMYLLNNKREAITELEERYGVKITFEGDHTIEGQDYTIEKGEPATRTPKKQAAVNPMHVENGADDGETSTSDSDGSDSNDEDREGGRKGRRRRGRGRGKNRDREENNANAEAESADKSDEASSDAAPDQEKGETASADVSADATQAAEQAEEDAGEKKRSRNRRPRGKKAAEKNEEASAPEETAAADVSAAADKAGSQGDEPETPAEPRRRTGRPGKKVKSESEEAADPKPVEEDSKPRNGAPPREVKRRNTRRVAKPKDEDGESGDQEPTSWSGGFLS